MNNKQTLIIPITIFIAIICHAIITKPIPVNVRFPSESYIKIGYQKKPIYTGRYQLIKESKDRFDTATGNMYNAQGKKYEYPKPIKEK